jgi:isochorismate synthase/2-succinyl-5-enolpyruvyl-6-hydroxy-3-cyclohexene-1-carboxylate synthase/2-succinyl-6-hydroxy-2,4-cyclohexadiene-1-carboxylate synthase/O-succinylbenzoate synthase
VIVALHKALNSSSSSSSQRVVLTADANRAWTLQQALCFAAALKEGLASSDAGTSSSSSSSGGGSGSSSSVLAYVEEPTQDPRDMSTFYAETGIAVAVDESLDEGLVGPQHVLLNPAAAEVGLNPNDSSSSSSSRERLDLSASSGLAAVVIKPAVVGGFERAWGLARWAQQEGLRVVISSSFESSVGLAALVQLAAAVDAAAAGSSSNSGGSDGSSSGGSSTVLPNGLWAGFGGSGLPSGTIAAAAGAGGATQAVSVEQQQQQQWHGLGTLSWFAGDAVSQANSLQRFGSSIPTAAAWDLLQQTGTSAVVAADVDSSSSSSSSSSSTPALQQCGSDVLPVQYQVLSAAGTAVVVTGSLVTPGSSSGSSGSNGQLPVVLLHGFMGADTDWHPLMAALAAAGHPCLAVNLPGHGGTGPAAAAAAAAAGECYSLETAAAVAEQAAAAAFGAGTPCLLVGYSMGARAAMQAVLGKQHPPQGSAATSSATTPSSNGGSSSSSSRSTVRWAGTVLISGTPGIPDPELRAARVAKDQEVADLLKAVGAASFLRWWYWQPLWASLRAHPGFERLLEKRVGEQEGQEEQLAASLTYASTGRMVRRGWVVGGW